MTDSQNNQTPRRRTLAMFTRNPTQGLTIVQQTVPTARHFILGEDIHESGRRIIENIQPTIAQPQSDRALEIGHRLSNLRRQLFPEEYHTEEHHTEEHHTEEHHTEEKKDLCKKGLDILEKANEEGYDEWKYNELCLIFKKLYND